MTGQQARVEMKAMLGVVPAFFDRIPEKTLGMEWELFKRVQMEEGAVPNKYRELIGLGISAVTKCKYCLFFHTEMARLMGATDAEIEDAVHYAKSSAGWSAYISGMGTDFEQFKDDVRAACAHIRRQQGTGARTGPKAGGRGKGRASGEWKGRNVTEERTGGAKARRQ